MSGLPDNWTHATLESLGQWGSGGTPPRTNSSYFEGGKIPWLIIGDLNDRVVTNAATRITEAGLANSSAKLLPPETLLVAMYGSIGKLGITGIECATNQAIAFCKPNTEIVSLRYLFYSVMNAKDGLVALGQGGAQQNISQGILKAYEIPLAPLGEQKRIADKLDAVLALVDACRNRLDRIPAILKRFRQSVLAAATSGALTEDWRMRNAVDENWSQRPLSSLTVKITDGEHITPRRAPSGKYLLSARNIQNGSIALENVDYVDEIEFERIRRRCDPSIGDVLLSCSGSVGRVALVDCDDCYVMVRSAAMLRPRQDLLEATYLMFGLQSPLLQTQIEEKSSATAQANIFLGAIRELVLPLPSIKEQTEIVRRVETLFAFADRLEARYTAARAQVEKLTPSLLAKAFRGELVPQDPNDEPASELLARICAQRNTHAASPPQRGRGRKAATS